MNYFLGFCERETRGCSYLLKVKPELAAKIEHPQLFHVIYAESLTTLLREFKMIKLAEFLELGEFILNPKMKVKTTLPTLPPNYLDNIRLHFNKSQFDALQKVCSKETGITLIQGPPGTGKTQTLLGIISSFLLSKNFSGEKQRLLVCAPSNSAIDEIAFRAIKQGLFSESGVRRENLLMVRIGNLNLNHLEIRQKNPNDLKEPPKSVKKIYLANLVSEQFKLEGLSVPEINSDKYKIELDRIDAAILKARNDNNRNIVVELEEKRRDVQGSFFREKNIKSRYKEKMKSCQTEILAKADIVFCTLSGAASREMQEVAPKFDFVLVDEACQSLELSTLIPFQYGARHAVLVGDPRQLPSTTFGINSSRICYNRSLFERLMDGGTEVIMLEIQYRMTKEICEFPSAIFYENRLVAADNLDSRPRPRWMPHQEILFFDLKSSKENKAQDETSLFNSAEAQFIVDIYEHLLGYHGTKLNIGIITPYKKQTRFIRDILHKKYRNDWKKDIEVNTVDGFQGREKDLIIFSAVRSGDSVGFLSDYRRMNVAITRAKFALWIIGNASCLHNNPI